MTITQEQPNCQMRTSEKYAMGLQRSGTTFH